MKERICNYVCCVPSIHLRVQMNVGLSSFRNMNAPCISCVTWHSVPVVVVVVVVVVLSNVDAGDPRCPIHGEDAIFTHKL